MQPDSSAAIARAGRIIGLALLALVCRLPVGTPSEQRYQASAAMVFGIWCGVEILLSYGKRA